jgi:hypothetical protein
MSKAKDQVAPYDFNYLGKCFRVVRTSGLLSFGHRQRSAQVGEPKRSRSVSHSDRSSMNENLVLISSREANCHGLACDASLPSVGLVVSSVMEQKDRSRHSAQIDVRP